YTGRINAEQTVKPWLKVGTNTSFTRTESQIFNDDGVYDRARTASPTLAVTDTLISLPDWKGMPDGEHNRHNPLNSLRIDNDRIQNHMVTTNFININPVEGLNFRTSFMMNYFNQKRYQFVPNDISESLRASSHGSAKQDFDSRLTWQWDNTVSYNKIVGKNRIYALFGTSTTKTNRNWLNAEGQGYFINDFSYKSIGSNMIASDGLKKNSLGSDFTTETLQSYIIRVNYDYASKYYLTVTARYDGSSKFAPGHQWGLFPSFSAAWNITEEAFMKDQNIFDQLKLRVGSGLVGNQNIGNFLFLTLYNLNGEGKEIERGLRRGTADISWESQQNSNIGLDFGFLNNRIRFSADAFLIKNKDLLMTRTLSTASGFKNATENIGTIENKGVEFTLDAQLVKTRDLEWNFSANLSADKNKVTKLYGNVEAVYNYNTTYQTLGKTGNLFLGESRNSIFILKSGGIAQQEDMARLNQIQFGRNVNPGDLYPLDISGPDGVPDGIISDIYDRVIVGSEDPKFYGGFSTDATWKGISLNVVFNYSVGAKKLSYMYESLATSVGRSPASIDLLDRWSPDNTGAKFPRPILSASGESYNVYSISDMDYSVQNASFLRLSALTLAYTLPKPLISSLKLSNVRIYTTASNLFIVTPYKGYDPETGDWYPPTRMFTFGLNLAF
ncbi:MAG: SusC/RagA family TonB-linked outer membrane protein, partial [Bacteroidales bacterium]|nr:SusC/RagA family TonB-linked outer membrane protein [Bacteroidales bacterium]